MEAANMRPGATPDTARYLRARAWAYIFDCWRNKQGRSATALNDEAETKEGSNGEQV